MTYKIGIVSKNVSFFKQLNALRRSSTEFEMEYVKSIETLGQIENAGKMISSFIFDDSHPIDDILSIGKYINESKRYMNALIFFALEDFNTFQKVTTDDIFKNAKIINMPTPTESIYRLITASTQQIENKDADKAPSAKTESKTNNSAVFLNIFIESTILTIKEMAMLEGDITHKKPGLLNYNELDKVAIRGKLAIHSPGFVGSFFICFPKETYLKMSSKILYEEVKEISKDNEDLVSELCNIVYGKSKVLAGKFDLKLGMVIPTHNRDEKIVHQTNVLVIKLHSELGEFYIKVAPGMS